MDSYDSNQRNHVVFKNATRKKIVFWAVFVIVLVLIVAYISYPTCIICGKKTSSTIKSGDADIPMCEEDQQKIYGHNTKTDASDSYTETPCVGTEIQSANPDTITTSKNDENNKNGYNAERPYYGMDERYINSTKIGTYNYKSFTVTLEGSGNAYTFIIDSRHAMYVKTADGIVVVVQYIEDGKKVLWSETSTGYHDWRR